MNPGPRNIPDIAQTPYDFFKLLFTEEMMEALCDFNNAHMQNNGKPHADQSMLFFSAKSYKIIEVVVNISDFYVCSYIFVKPSEQDGAIIAHQKAFHIRCKNSHVETSTLKAGD